MKSQTTSIRRKIMTVIMLASITGLMVTVAAFMVYDWVTFRQTMVQNLGTEARIIAENGNGALTYLNETDAKRILNCLRTEKHVTVAAFYDLQGKLFAKYPAGVPDDALPAKPEGKGYHFGNSQLVYFQPVTVDGDSKPIGTLYLCSDLSALTQRLQLYVGISLLIILGAMLVIFWISDILQRRISEPIIALARIAQKISKGQDYSLRATRLSDDELGLLTSSFNDMLERIETSDSALRASETQIRLVTDHAPVLLAQMDRHYLYKFVNQPYAEHFGRKFNEIIGHPAIEIVGQQLFERARPYVDKALAGQQVQFELEIGRANAERRWSHVEYTPEKNASGEVVGLVAVHTDITERKRAEKEVEDARDRAVAASRAKDDFLAALSHELRTPLNPVLLVASDAAADSKLPLETRAQFDMIRRNIEMEARLIDDLLDLTRVTRGKLSLEKQPLDVRGVLEDALAIVQAEADKKQITLTRHFEFGAHFISGDAVRLQQIFWNLLKNAVKFTPDGGQIKIDLCTLADSGKIAIIITDTGIGLTTEEISHVFDAFSQGDHAGSHRFGGLGLGLTISRKLVELHSAVIHAASAGRNQGATFTVEFPALPIELNQPLPKNLDNSPITKSIAPQRKSGRRILLVEDHEPTRTALAHLLLRRDYKVLTAASVTEARALVQRENFDLVVSDIGLPDGDGYTLMSELRTTFGLKGIALSGYGMEQDLMRGKNAGFLAYIIKPVRVESLEKALSDVG